MSRIQLLDSETINKIAAGEVIDRPASIVKELVENAIDAGASSVTLEIRDGGTSLIRVTDNGSGLEQEQVAAAFLRHATSKIRSAKDLECIETLGFRGEALSSIAAVSRVELITKTREALTGCRYRIEGGVEKSCEEVGTVEGTTFLVRDLFYNTPARKKFLKSATSEAAAVRELTERLALSHPEISVKLIVQGRELFFTSGNGRLRDAVYAVLGREFAAALLPVNYEGAVVHISGFVGKPELARGSRGMEYYFINGRTIRSRWITDAIEEAFAGRIMQHRFPFTLLMLTLSPELTDVNVHPSKMEIRFRDPSEIAFCVREAIGQALAQKELIPRMTLPQSTPLLRERADFSYGEAQVSGYESDTSSLQNEGGRKETQTSSPEPFEERRRELLSPLWHTEPEKVENPVQESFLEAVQASEHGRSRIELLGQLFETYWLVEWEKRLYFIDQHAAHEKILYESFLRQQREGSVLQQQVSPPLVLTLSATEKARWEEKRELLIQSGFWTEDFGGNEIAVSGVPATDYQLTSRDLLLPFIEELCQEEGDGQRAGELMAEKLAVMACKAAIKGGQRISREEAQALIEQLLSCENPYSCPHGRPILLELTKTDLEKQFKRIV